MNKVMLIGRLTRDPDIKATTTGMTVASFSLAVNRRKKDEADFINCKAFDKTADVVSKYCAKGKQVCVLGRIQTGSYENREGRKVYTTDVMVDELELLGSKDEAKPAPNPEKKASDNSGFYDVPHQDPVEDNPFLDAQMNLDDLDSELPFI